MECEVSAGSSCNSKSSFPKVSPVQLLAHFGGNEERLNYYLSLKAALSEMRGKTQDLYHCDPRDVGMAKRLRQCNWSPSIIFKTMEDAHVTGSSGFVSKQTAVDDDPIPIKTAENGASIQNSYNETNAGKETSDRTSRQWQSDRCFTCGIHGCEAKFSSLASYESHYHTAHSFVCSECRRVIVSSFLLDIHLQENHDSYFQILAPRIDMYRCLVESCNLKFRTPDVRKDHLVTEHKYPSNFSFHRPISHKDKKKSQRQTGTSSESTSMDAVSVASVSPFASHHTEELQPPLRTEASVTEMDVDISVQEGKLDQLSCDAPGLQEMSCRKHGRGGKGRGKSRVPPTVCFGRGSQRAFVPRGRHRGRHWHQRDGGEDTRTDIETLDMSDMRESLNA